MLERMRRAHASSSLAAAGLQMKTCARLGVSPIAFVVAADGEVLELLPVQADVDPALMRRAERIGVTVLLELDAQHIFRIEREIVAHGQAAARTQGKVLAHPVVLDEESRQ